ncbi:EAL domain-containing protein [Halomonas sp. NO4]|uniref:sensor domain-containing protein n=1 Tax=Halomonas sp. NO4 TaxID=2484813 RepID=UPI0013D731C0|nr:EAL domain-containing protein [Halomonas sp. NO4]
MRERKEGRGRVVWSAADGGRSTADLSQELKHFYTAVEQSPLATAITDPSGRLLYVNRRFMEVTGYRREELIGHTSALIQSGKTSERTYRELWETLRAGREWRGELLNRRKNGEEYWEYELITPIFDEAGEITSYVTVKQDITGRKEQEDQLRLMATAFETGQATLITDAEMRIERVNRAFTQITGYRGDEVIGQTPRLFKSGRHGPEFYAALWASLQQQGHWQGEIWNRNKRGEIYPVWQSITAVRGDHGEVRHYVSVFHDIDERKRLEQTLAREASRDHLTGAANRRSFDRALIKSIRAARQDGSELALMLFDIVHFKAVNDNHGHDVGDAILHALTELVQRRLRKSDLLARWGGEEFTLLLPETSAQGACRIAERLRADVAAADMPGPRVTISIGLTTLQPGDTARDMLLRADRALYRAKRSGRNCVERLDRDSALADSASRTASNLAILPPLGAAARYIDEYRGASQRSRLIHRLEQALDQARRREGRLLVCALDVDHFKTLNERLGQPVADRLILLLVQRLNRQLGREDLIVRTGGDEFVLLIHDSEGDGIAEQLLTQIRRPFVLGKRTTSITASLGMALFPPDDREADMLLRHAQQAMFRAKQSGRNTVSRFDAGQDRRLQHCLSQRRRVEQAIAENELRVHYQPQIDMSTSAVVGFEALVRWQHPERGLLAPAEFLPLIEGSWLEQALGEWVLKAVLDQLGCWTREGRELPVSVNISPSHLLAPDFATRLDGLLATKPGVSPSRLKLEVVETAAMRDIAAALEVISRCQAMGVQVAIDDFGTGFSSLTYLRQLPVDLIKVDKSFVSDMLSDTDDRAMVESVIYMARRFDRELLAEGVESLGHASALLGLGCRLAQGYGIARPMPAETLADWLEAWPARREWQELEPAPA